MKCDLSSRSRRTRCRCDVTVQHYSSLSGARRTLPPEHGVPYADKTRIVFNSSTLSITLMVVPTCHLVYLRLISVCQKYLLCHSRLAARWARNDFKRSYQTNPEHLVSLLRTHTQAVLTPSCAYSGTTRANWAETDRRLLKWKFAIQEIRGCVRHVTVKHPSCK
jgi:hypothetical protein